MAARPLRPPGEDPSSRLRVFFLSLTISASLLLLIAILFLFLYLYFFLFRRSRTLPFDSSAPLKLHKFSYKDLKSATHSFGPANFIGKGGSGSVYRGILSDGKSVAVKKLDPSSSQPDREFRNETQILGGIRSPFVVSLLGYCFEKQRRFLVYEYMSNRSLQEALFSAEGDCPSLLRWANRFEIILDVARGLQFLHLECDPPVVHGDIKPSNVLLGMDFRAKISDFGLSRVKMEGEMGIDFFSHELGRSQELWKSQELSGNLGNNEVGFVHALNPPSSSSKNNNSANYNQDTSDRVDWNGKSSGCRNNTSSKGKEVTNEFGAYDDELGSVDHSNELNLNPLSPSAADDQTSNSKKWGRDWWWKQDASGELSSKDYVMEWIGSQICPTSNPDWDNDLKLDVAVVKPDLAYSVEALGALDEAAKKEDSKAGTAAHLHNKCDKSNRQMKEWWKEEYFAEMNSKRGDRKQRNSKLEGRWKRGLRTMRFDVSRKLQLRRDGKRREETMHQTGLNSNAISFAKGWRKKKKKKKLSVNSEEAWNGDLFSRELSSTTTSMRGTICYVAPEYGGCGYLMEKADIYSFGVLILVVVSGRRPLHVLSSPMKLEQANLISWCRNLAQRGNVLDLVDEKLKGEFNKDQARLCINLALMCLQKMPELRPDAGDIVKTLKGEMDLPSLPLEYSPSPPSKLFSRSRRRAAEAE